MKTLNLIIRDFNHDDYAQLTHLANTVYPEYPVTEEEMRGWDARRDPKINWHRWVLELDGQVIGSANFENIPWMFHPQKFSVGVDIHPKFQGQGFGTQLYSFLKLELEKHHPLLIRARAREDHQAAVAFAHKQGFVEDTRDFESRLDPNALSYAELAGLKESLEAAGIHFMRLNEYMALRPNYKQMFYDLDMEISKDVPYPEGETHTKPDFEIWVSNFFDNPNFQAEAHLLAIYQSEAIGFNCLWPTKAEPDCIYNGLTGIKRAFRRKGIARALKLENLKWVKDQGYTVVKTWNNSQNKGMLAINEALGFKRQPAWIILKKSMDKTHE